MVFSVIVRTMIDPPAQRSDLGIEGRRFFSIFNKIKLHVVSVDMPIKVHDQRFRAAKIHASDHMQYSNWPSVHINLSLLLI